MGDEGDPGAPVDPIGNFIDNKAARALYQPPFGRSRFALPQHDDRLPGNPMEQGKRIHF